MFDILQAKELFLGARVTYLILVNAAGLILMGWDKFMSKISKKRIPEKSLFLTAVIGGSIGIWLGMGVFRHKTRHTKFIYGIPLIFILQTGIAVLLLSRL